jgi:hypothetical protein
LAAAGRSTTAAVGEGLGVALRDGSTRGFGSAEEEHAARPAARRPARTAYEDRLCRTAWHGSDKPGAVAPPVVHNRSW